MKRMNQSGFAALEAVLIFIILGIVGFTGWYVWHSKQSTDKSLTDTANSQPGIAKKTAQSTKKSTPPTDATASWLLYTSPNNTFTMRLADGWKLNQCNGSELLYTYNAADVALHAGTKAVVTSIQCGSDGNAVGLFINYLDADQRTTPYSTALPSFKTNDGVTVDASTETSTSDPEGLGGLPKGATGYHYTIRPSSGALMDITYGFNQGDVDAHTAVEQAIKTIHFN